jgi:glutathione S-transferase
MAAHVLLEEGGEKYEPIRLDLAKGEQRSEAYLKLNPLGRVPVLRLDDGTRSPRTRRYCPISASGSGCGPRMRWARRNCCAERILRGPDKVLKTFHGYLKDIDARLAGREWFSNRYSAADPYGLVFYAWGARRELPVGEFKNYTAFKDRMLQRPAVRRALDDEQIKV